MKGEGVGCSSCARPFTLGRHVILNNQLLSKRSQAIFYASDLLWLNGEDCDGRALLLDGEDRVSYEVQMQEDLFTDRCSDPYARNLVDLTATVK